jgi:NADH dehydrogenase (ubiquinone) 1 alpha subcomplex subunit 9
MGDLGVVCNVPFNPRDEDSVRRAIEGSDVVINLIGKDYETKHYAPTLINYGFQEVHVKIPEMLARISVEQGVTNFIHLSALGADQYSSSEWARTKAAGEQAVRAIAPGATIMRPADIFGPEDRFLTWLARLYSTLPRIPLVDGGNTRVQPLYVDDLAHAIFKVAMVSDGGSNNSSDGPDVAVDVDFNFSFFFSLFNAV